jgi:hypothetical protein
MFLQMCTLLLDKKRQLHGRGSALEEENKELNATLAELEAAQKTKTYATTADTGDLVALRREQLASDRMKARYNLHEMRVIET